MHGTLIGGKYRTIRLLGRGGMGEVYEAEDERDGTRVAVKLIHDRDNDGAFDDLVSRKGRFLREAKVAAALDSEHVAKVLDWGTDDKSGSPFMVMELLEGEDLQRIFKRVDVLPADAALRIVAQACKGLAKAHEARILHRDIKPANLFLATQPNGDLVVKILDFGIAKVRSEQGLGLDTTGLTRTGTMLGSPLYMSPEQARGSAELDDRSDLWSLGVVLYRALSGHLPHENVAAFGELILVLCSQPPKPVQQIAPWVAPELAALVGRVLQVDRDKRFGDTRQMLEALEALLPDGDRLRPEMLVPLDDAARASVARRHVSPSTELERATTLYPPAPPASPDGPSTVSGAVRASSTGTSPRRWRGASSAAVVGVALVAASLGALGVMRATSPSIAPPGAAGAAGATLPAIERAPSERTVSVVILPAEARVEVEEIAVPVRDGMITLRGPLGSRHRVVLMNGTQRVAVDVVIADGGAMPPKIELPPKPADSPSAVKPPPAAQGKPAPTAKPAAPPRKDPLIPERFE